VRSCTSPQYEDSNGRNGLHYLTEVSLSFPFPKAIPEHDRGKDNSAVSKRRENFLDHLLVAGADPDNHDMEGLTPLMAFILYTRAAEDDEATNRLLWRL
jgi:ankyrin repeat protein